MKEAVVFQGLGFGDEGKGSCVDSAVRHYDSKLVIKYTGGPQCAHRVQLADGRSHVFAQFGSGTFVPGCKTLIGPDVLVNPLAMEHEEEFLQKQGVKDAFDRMHIHENCVVITPYHRALNKLRELARGKARHGSCGHGVGETRKQNIDRPDLTIRIKDLNQEGSLKKKLTSLRDYLCAEVENISGVENINYLQHFYSINCPSILVGGYVDFARNKGNIFNAAEVAALINAETTIIFEGAQGVLLDQDYGFHPYTTWSDCTMTNAHRMLVAADYRSKVTRIGVMRTYMTRHGAGPFVTRRGVAGLSDSSIQYPQDAHNETNDWQGSLRCGHLDLVALKYALAVNGKVDGLAVTHCDVMEKEKNWPICSSYWDDNGHWQLTDHMPSGIEPSGSLAVMMSVSDSSPSWVPQQDVLKTISKELNTPVLITSHGPTAEDKTYDHRN